jgi:hypothetical protein
VIAFRRAAAVFALVLAAGVHPAAAQVVSEEACTDAKELIRYLTNEGAFVQEASMKYGLDQLANAVLVRNAACGTPGDEAVPPPAATEPPPPSPVPSPTPVATPTPVAATENSATRRDACLLVTEGEVGTAMKQGVVANEADPFGDPVPGVQGCEFDGVLAGDGGSAVAYTALIYFQADAQSFYDGFRSIAEANGVQAVPGLGDRAFVYVGGNGPGVVVAKGDKLFTMEFSGIGSGATEKSSLLTLAQQAVGRVH